MIGIAGTLKNIFGDQGNMQRNFWEHWNLTKVNFREHLNLLLGNKGRNSNFFLGSREHAPPPPAREALRTTRGRERTLGTRMFCPSLSKTPCRHRSKCWILLENKNSSPFGGIWNGEAIWLSFENTSDRRFRSWENATAKKILRRFYRWSWIVQNNNRLV